eukprot:scaffold143463_cov16-Tisochrysis_lutea.AAC.1
MTQEADLRNAETVGMFKSLATRCLDGKDGAAKLDTHPHQYVSHSAIHLREKGRQTQASLVFHCTDATSA